MGISNIVEKMFLNGSFTQEEYRYAVRYQCDSDSSLDGPDVVRRDPFFRIGKSYSFGNDSNPAARLQEVTPSLVSQNKKTFWHVDCVFSTAQEETDSGDPAPDSKDNPPGSGANDEPDSLEIRFIKESELVHRAKFKDTWEVTELGFGETPRYTRLGGEDGISGYIGVPLASTFQPIEPRPMRDRTLAVLRVNVKQFASAWIDDVLELVGKINKASYKIKAPNDIWSKTFPPNTLRLEDATHAPITGPNNGYVMFSLEFVYDPRGHYLWLVDEGTAVRNDMTRETEGTATGRLPYDNAVNPKLETIRDETGAAIAQPSLLNGNGGILEGNNISYIHRYLEDVDVQGDFSKLPSL